MTDRGEPYRKKYVLVVPDKEGVRAAGIMESDAPFGQILDPSHVFSDENGILRTPNFELNDEMVTLSYANLLYEANTTAFKTSRQMFQKYTGAIKVNTNIKGIDQLKNISEKLGAKSPINMELLDEFNSVFKEATAAMSNVDNELEKKEQSRLIMKGISL